MKEVGGLYVFDSTITRISTMADPTVSPGRYLHCPEVMVYFLCILCVFHTWNYKSSFGGIQRLFPISSQSSPFLSHLKKQKYYFIEMLMRLVQGGTFNFLFQSSGTIYRTRQ